MSPPLGILSRPGEQMRVTTAALLLWPTDEDMGRSLRVRVGMGGGEDGTISDSNIELG